MNARARTRTRCKIECCRKIDICQRQNWNLFSAARVARHRRAQACRKIDLHFTRQRCISQHKSILQQRFGANSVVWICAKWFYFDFIFGFFNSSETWSRGVLTPISPALRHKTSRRGALRIRIGTATWKWERSALSPKRLKASTFGFTFSGNPKIIPQLFAPPPATTPSTFDAQWSKTP